MELERSFPWLQKFATFIYSVKDVLVHTLSLRSFKAHFNIILLSLWVSYQQRIRNTVKRLMLLTVFMSDTLQYQLLSILECRFSLNQNLYFNAF